MSGRNKAGIKVDEHTAKKKVIDTFARFGVCDDCIAKLEHEPADGFGEIFCERCRDLPVVKGPLTALRHRNN